MFRHLTIRACEKGGYNITGEDNLSRQVWAFTKLDEALTFISNNMVKKDASSKAIPQQPE